MADISKMEISDSIIKADENDQQQAGASGVDAATSSATTNTAAAVVSLPAPPRAAELFETSQQQQQQQQPRLYWDRSHYSTLQDQMNALSKSSTLYVGNLAFSTRLSHVRAHFSMIGGAVKKLYMGLDRIKKTPCGFCFVEYYRRSDALAAVALLSGTKLDNRIIRVELDAGYQPGRQYGRGTSGGQVRDDRRKTMDPARKRSHSTTTAPTSSTTPFGGGGSSTTANTMDHGGTDSDAHEPAAKRQRT